MEHTHSLDWSEWTPQGRQVHQKKHFMFDVDLDAKNHEANTPRNLASIAVRTEVTHQFLVWEIEDYITSARFRHKMTAGLKDMKPRQKRLWSEYSAPSAGDFCSKDIDLGADYLKPLSQTRLLFGRI